MIVAIIIFCAWLAACAVMLLFFRAVKKFSTPITTA
jgi:hypothetical protein